MNGTTTNNACTSSAVESGHDAEERMATFRQIDDIVTQAGFVRAEDLPDPELEHRRREVLRTIDRAVATEERAAGLPSAAWSEYNDAMEHAHRAVDDLMRRRATVADTMHGIYAAPSIGGASVLAESPQVLRGDTGELRLRLLPKAPDDDAHPERGGPRPVTQVVVVQPHDIAVLVTPMDVFIMQARELFA